MKDLLITLLNTAFWKFIRFTVMMIILVQTGGGRVWGGRGRGHHTEY